MKQTAYVKTRSNNEEVQAGLIAFTWQHADINSVMWIHTKTSKNPEALCVTFHLAEGLNKDWRYALGVRFIMRLNARVKWAESE